MSINYGKIHKYNTARGFGFVKRRLGASRQDHIFFHIKKIRQKYAELVHKIESRFSPEINFWYTTESTEKGEQISDVWLQADELPLQAREEVIDYIIKFWLNNVTFALYILEERDRLFLERDPRIQEQKEKEATRKQRREQLEELQRREIQEAFQRVEAKQQQLEAERQAEQQRLEAERERIRSTLDELISLAQLPNSDKLINKIKFGLSSIPVEVQDRFWYRISSKITYGTSLYEIAPTSIRTSIVHKKFNDVLDCMRKCISLPDFRYFWRPEEFYGYLREEDWKLAQEWLEGQLPLTNERRPFVEAKMLSARAAEKVVFFFFRSLDQWPKDIAIKQLSHNSEDWKSHDLLLKNGYRIDVKNSRTSRNQRNYYVEHCIPRFKYTTERKDVIIAGVLSPYIRLEGFVNPKEIKHYNVGPIIFLGITSRDKITNLQEIFTTDQFRDIEIIKNPDEEFHVVPPWIFDYPKEFYKEQTFYRKWLKNIPFSDYPSWEEFKELGINPLPAIIATGLSIPLAWQNSLLPWQLGFCEKITPSSNRISLPRLYLTILTHFLRMLSSREGNDTYQPLMYALLLYSNPNLIKVPNAHDDKVEQEIERKNNLPLGIVDPLSIIDNLVISLQIVWEHRISNDWDLSQFQVFSFKGLGWLVGSTDKSFQSRKTILAYCGGKDGDVSCGNTPLLIGKHETCVNCGRLICDKCGFCSESCRNNKNDTENEKII